MKKSSRLVKLVFSLAIVLSMLLPYFNITQAATGLTVEIIAAPNLVVDSNVLSPSSYQPIVATVIGKFCNSSGSQLDGVVASIGEYDQGTPANSTPGDYPDSETNPAPGSTTYRGVYQFTHLGGTADATRFIGSLLPGECRYQYWSFSYPKTAIDDADGSTIPTWGNSVKPEDDLSLDFDIWATYLGQTPTYATHTMTMRNEISAMANKIKPNGNPGGEWFNTDTSTVLPGDKITTNGILYRLGNVNKGFDNDGDGVPDYNAWLQPFGDPAYDPSCFRLVETSGVLTVTTNTGDVIIPFSDNLYFTDLPMNNTDVVGEVFYTFLALGGACTIPITPYQEVASGSDNEKFNGDYGTGIPPLMTYEPEVIFSKTDGVGTVAGGGTLNYTIPFYNNSFDATAGLTLSAGGVNMPLAFEDSVPSGAQYDCNTAAYTLDFTPNTGVTIYYSDDSGATWSTDENSICSSGDPTSTSPNNLVKIRWWLNDPLPKRAADPNTSAGEATFSALIPSTFVADAGTPVVENCVSAGFGDGEPFGEACDTTLAEGNNSIGDHVWDDANLNGLDDSESGISGVDVFLYWDKNQDGLLDDGEPLLLTDTTDISGDYLFSNLPDAFYIVKIDPSTAPEGYRPINPANGQIDVDLDDPGDLDILTADFGLGPVLDIEKTALERLPTASNGTITYKIDLINQLPGSGDNQHSCVYYAWADTHDTSHDSSKLWDNPANAINAAGPDSVYATANYDTGASKLIAGTGFASGAKNETITQVEALFSLYTTGTFDADYATGKLFYDTAAGTAPERGTNTFTTGQLQALGPGPGNADYLVWDVSTVDLNGTDVGTPYLTDSWSYFDGTTNLDLLLSGDKDASADPATLYLDAMGFRITTDGTCGDGSTDITYLPVVDTFDSTVLEFVSASVNPDNTIPTGTLTWNNLGPLYAGGVRELYVTFRVVLDATSAVNNTATSTGSEFSDGLPTNSPVSDTAPILAVVGDRIWFDINADGVQDANESGIPGAVVELWQDGNSNGSFSASQDDLRATATTDANGNYLFSGMTLDTTYFVRVLSVPTGYSGVSDRDGGGFSNVHTFVPASNNVVNLTYDFGYDTSTNNAGGVNGYIWNDINADGVIDTGEQGFDNITVELCTGTPPTCSSQGTTTTDADGFYQFPNIAAGTNYFVRVTTPPASTTQTYEYNATCASVACDGSTVNLTVSNNTITSNINLGYRATGTSEVGNLVWRDWNADGAQDTGTGEEGIPGLTVTLYLDNDNDGVLDTTDYLYATRTTSSFGGYLFQNLPAGNWIVVVSPPADHYQTYDPDETGGVCRTCDSLSLETTSGTGDVHYNEDFGYKPIGSGIIGDFVYRDLNGDGDQDAGEPGIPNITVNLYEDTDASGDIDPANDALIATQVTDEDGNYLFENLYLTRYLVDVDTADADLPKDGSGLVYILSTNNDPDLVVLSSGSPTDYTADFGFLPRSAIGDLIWQDDNGNGQWETNEPGIAGVVVNLYLDADNNGTADGAAIANDTTDADGYYRFDGLFPNNYIVEVVTSGVLAGYTQTGDPDDTDLDCSTDDPAVSTDTCDNRSWLAGYSITVNSVTTNYNGLEAGQTDMSRDFGYQPPGVLGDMVWIDTDDDGVRDLEEQGLAGVTVYLCTTPTCDENNTTVITTTTDENGAYSFGNLSNDDYYIAVEPDDLPNGLTQTFGAAEQTRTVISNIDLTVDFGYRFAGDNTINGTVWNDAFADKQIAGDGSEDIRYPSVPVYLWNCGTGTCDDGDEILVSSTLTDGSGNYSFTNLAGGVTTPVTYRVVANSSALSLRGTTTTTPVSVNPSGTDTPSVTFNSDTPSTATLNFGYQSNLDLGDLPAAYNNTLLADNGARHPISGNLFLGSSQPDPEADGQESIAATGDGTDEAGVTREMGIAGPSHLGWTNGTVASGNGGRLDITVGGVWSGVPQVFIDYDGDDTNYFLTEVALRDAVGNPLVMPLAPNATAYAVYFDIPAGTFDGSTTPNPIFVRVRLSTTGGLGATGLADNGEVEDYQWDFGPNAVKLADFSVKDSSSTNWVVLLVAAALLLVIVSLFFIQRKRNLVVVRRWNDR